MEQMGRFKKVFVTLAILALIVGLGYGVSRAMKDSDKAPSKSTGVPIMVPGNFTEIAENVRNGVVDHTNLCSGKVHPFNCDAPEHCCTGRLAH